ncbi:SRPBCC family protein [Amycolatopsis thermoflava]|uniref:Polyketide cyclase/dehydrase/lipid transport protein n=1 Tax=Amycolatopsis thermoflava TaxID=84480 RepID=A0A3N2H6M2_9PSEU|nr:SRPBCC family protein [Amycolatopsis thermoflava]ROS43990.1 polyketide cyclase/dehydrase/lipid transport protein [Amycolatopsis thermoflava]
MQFEVTRRIDAVLDTVWAVLSDVAKWPSWTASMSSVRLRTPGRLRVGSEAVVKQPGLAPLVWRVTELTDRQSFTWQAQARGVTSIGWHRLTADGDGAVTAVLGVEQRGPLAPLAGLLFGARIRRFVTMEADGLRRAAESG